MVEATGNAPAATFAPTILALCCNWCGYAGIDHAGIAKEQYPASVRIVKVNCIGRVRPELVLEAFGRGADGVLVIGCHLGDCHFVNGNATAVTRLSKMPALLETIGIPNAGGSMLIDQEMRLFAGPALGTQVIVSDYGDHESVANFPYQTLFAQACALELPEAGNGMTYTPILRTSPTSWAEKDLKRLLEQQEAEPNADDIRGPVTIGAAFTGFPALNTEAAPAVDAAGIVICDSDFVSNRMIGQVGNADLALNLVAWLSGETDRIAIGPKKRGMSQLLLSQEQMVNIFYGTVLIFPELLLLTGLFVWWQRRQQK